MPEDILKKLGTHLKKSREDRNLTQERLADLSGVAVRTISKIECGKMNPSFEILYILVSHLGMSFDSLFAPTDSQSDTDIQEIALLYRNCSRQGQRLILASTRALVLEMNKEEPEQILAPLHKEVS